MTGFIAFPAAHRFLLYCKIYIDVKYSQVPGPGACQSRCRCHLPDGLLMRRARRTLQRSIASPENPDTPAKSFRAGPGCEGGRGKSPV
jgi:hypothetical protein